VGLVLSSSGTCSRTAEAVRTCARRSRRSTGAPFVDRWPRMPPSGLAGTPGCTRLKDQRDLMFVVEAVICQVARALQRSSAGCEERAIPRRRGRVADQEGAA